MKIYPLTQEDTMDFHHTDNEPHHVSDEDVAAELNDRKYPAPMAQLVRSRAVLNFVAIDGDHAVFVADGSTQVMITQEKWTDMGEPEQITVVIEPGNTIGA